MAHHARLWEDKMLYGMMSLAEAYTGYELDIAENAATVDLAKARLSSIVVASRYVQADVAGILTKKALSVLRNYSCPGGSRNSSNASTRCRQRRWSRYDSSFFFKS